MILLLVGSPRGRMSTSSSLAKYLDGQLVGKGKETKTLWINEQLVNDERTDAMMKAIHDSDTIVVTAPLYDDCQPYIVTRTMEIMGERGGLDGKKFMVIINSGFPQPEQITAAAIPIYEMFSRKTGMTWIGSLSIAGGEGLQGASGRKLEEVGGMANNVMLELDRIAESLATNTGYGDQDVLAFPKFFAGQFVGQIMLWINNRAWKSMATKNGGKVDARPYA